MLKPLFSLNLFIYMVLLVRIHRSNGLFVCRSDAILDSNSLTPTTTRTEATTRTCKQEQKFEAKKASTAAAITRTVRIAASTAVTAAATTETDMLQRQINGQLANQPGNNVCKSLVTAIF